jgi:hypothetical protein
MPKRVLSVALARKRVEPGRTTYRNEAAEGRE